MEFRTLKANEVECRVSQIASNYCTLLLYKDARVDQDILDETVGVLNWKKDYQLIDGQLFCTISIWDDEKKQWIGKQDVGVESFSQEEKGRASDAQKRSAFCFGIGRELYTAPSIFIIPRKDIKYRITIDNKQQEVDEFYKNSKDKYETKTRFWVEIIDYDEDRNIKDLIIRDNKNNVRFSQLTKEKEKELFEIDIKLKKLIEDKEDKEDKDEKFSREKFYEYYKTTSDAQMTYKQKQDAIKLLEVK